MTDTPIPSALAPEEWAVAEVTLQCNPIDPGDALRADVSRHGMEIDGWEIPPAKRHALAALCLYGQPFGFTQEEAAAVRYYAEHVMGLFRQDAPALASAAAKIAALLPPPETP